MLRDKRPEPVGDVSDSPDEVFDLRPKPLVIRFPSVTVAGRLQTHAQPLACAVVAFYTVHTTMFSNLMSYLLMALYEYSIIGRYWDFRLATFRIRQNG